MGATNVSGLGYSPAPAAAPPAGAAAETTAAAPVAHPVAVQPQRACDRVLAWADEHRYKLFAALAVMYLLGFNGQWRPEPDSALYLTIGRNVSLGEGYTYHGAPHRLVFPGLPMLFAGLYSVFGPDSVVPQHLLMLAMGAAALALTYRLFLLHAGRPMAVVVTLLVGVSRTFYLYNFELLSDLPFMLAVMAFLVGYEGVVHRHAEDDPTPTPYERGRPHPLDWALLLGGLAAAVVTRPAMLALLAAVAGAALWPILRGRGRRAGLAVFIIVVAAGVVFYAFDPRGGGDYERMLFNPELFPRHLERALTHNLPKLFEPTIAETVFAVDLTDVGNVVVSVVLALTAFSLFRAHVLWGMLVVMTGGMLVAVEVHVRYLLFILPLLVYAWLRVLMWVDHRLRPGIGDRLFAGVFAFFLITNLVRVGDVVVEQRRMPVLDHYKRGRFAALPELAAAVRERTEPDAWILVRHKLGRILTFTSGKYAVEPRPNDASRLDPDLQDVYVLDPVDNREEGKVDTNTSDWMAQRGIGRGEEIFRLPDDGFDWVLSRAVNLPGAPGPAQARGAPERTAAPTTRPN
jgi:hypothetical protein